MFARFSSDLYCSGAQERMCATPGGAREHPGQCHWRRRAGNVTSGIDNTTLFNTSMRFAVLDDEWAPDASTTGCRHFGRLEAARCTHGRRLLFLGDSTVRDTFYEALAVAGRPVWSWSKHLQSESSIAALWPASSWQPYTQLSSMARDAFGLCNGDGTSKPPQACLRDVFFPCNRTRSCRDVYNDGNASRHRAAAGPGDFAGPGQSRFSYQYLMSNATWELQQLTRLLRARQENASSPAARRGYDAAFIQCPTWFFFMPKAYDGTTPHHLRHTVHRPSSFDGLGAMCRQIIELVRRESPRARLYLLGLSALPRGSLKRFRAMHEDEPKVVEQVHSGLGLRCTPVRNAGGGAAAAAYELESQHGIVPVDRYNVWGLNPRKRDTIHPFFNAQFALVQLLLNHLCPGPAP